MTRSDPSECKTETCMTFDILEARLVRVSQMPNMRAEELAIAKPKQVLQVEAS